MSITRRQFLTRTGLTVGSFLLPGGVLDARAAVDPSKVLVTVFLKGGADGLNLVIPAGDPNYYDARPHVSIPEGDEIPLDGFFAAHPAFAPLLPVYAGGDLAVVHAVGSTDPTRSHFDARDYMNHAAPGDKSIRDGWLNRYLAKTGLEGCFTAVNIGLDESEALAGPATTLSLLEAGQLYLFGGQELRRDYLDILYTGASQHGMEFYMDQALACLDPAALVGPKSSGYPATELGADLGNLAALIKADVGVHLAGINHPGWDTHNSELRELDSQVDDLARSLAAFYNDLGSHASRTLVLVVTEFGRRLRENSTGTDHGHGSVMFLMGGGVNGGRIHLTNDLWPGLADQDLYEGRDLQVTSDFRSVYFEVLNRFMGLGSNDTKDVLLGFGLRTLRSLFA
jgi:uncharacterized protein (DUF1501 family)